MIFYFFTIKFLLKGEKDEWYEKIRTERRRNPKRMESISTSDKCAKYKFKKHV